MLGRLHVIVDVSPTSRDPMELVRLAIAGGAPVIQVRVKNLADHAAYEVCAQVAERCEQANVACVINDRVDMALAVDAAGVHVGLTDLPVAVAARLLGAHKVLGGTARDAFTARIHEQDGATYLGIGPIYATESKVGLPDPLGVSVLRDVCAAVRIPVIAISGITVANVAEVLEAGAYGVAVIGAVSRADDPKAATAALVAAIEGRGLAVGR